MADTADCCGLNDRKRDKTWKTYQRGNIQAAHFLVYTQPTARNGARSVDARERRRRNGLVRRQTRRARTRDARRVGLLRASQCVWTVCVEDAVSFKEVPASYDENFTLDRRVETSWIARRVEHLEHVAVFFNVATKFYPKIATWW